MTNLEITVNGEKVTLAALNAEYGVVSAMVTCVRRVGEDMETLTIEVSGLNSQTGEQVKWIREELRTSDEVNVKLLSSAAT